MSSEIYILLGTIFGGVGLKVIEAYLNRGKEKVDLASQIRDELREDIERYKNEVSEYKREVKELTLSLEDWKKKYYDLLEGHGKLKDANYDQQMQLNKLKEVLRKNNITYEM